MTASIWLVAVLACAQVDDAAGQAAPGPAEDAPIPRVAANRITAGTVYHGNALVTREVSVPEGEGDATLELVVSPLPPQTIDSSLYAEGTDGLRVLSTRYRTRAVKEDTRAEVRAKEEQIATLELTAE